MVDGPAAGERAVLRTAVLGQWRRLLPASLLSMVHQACEALVPVLIGVAIDVAVARQDPIALVEVLVAFVVLFAVLTTSMRGSGRLIRRATQGAGHALRVRITERVLDPRGVDRATVGTGEVFSISTSDAQRVGMVNAAVWTTAGALAALLVGAVLLLRASVLLGVVVLVGLVPVFLVTSLLTTPLVRRSGAEQAAGARAAATATDLLTGLRVLAGLGAQAVVEARYAAVSAAARDAGTRAAALNAVRGGLATAVTGLFFAVVAVLGGSLALDGTISVGEFIAALGLTGFLIGPFSRITVVTAQVARGSASARRAATLLDAPYAVGSGVPGRRPGDGPALDLLDLDVGVGPPLTLRVGLGESVGVVLTTPGAAEALLPVLGRELDAPDGRILIGGVPADQLEPVAARRFLHVARHDAELFSGTIEENIGFGAATGELVAVATRAADADQVADTVPGGLGARVTERGRSLSGGQRQRVALARALATDAPVLVLHDPTTAVDAVTEAEIADRLRAMRAGRATVLITTSPALLAIADRVVLVDPDGRHVESTHVELAATSERYREVVIS